MYELNYYNFEAKNKNKSLLLAHTKQIINNIETDNSYYKIFKKQDSHEIIKPFIEIAKQIRNNFADLIVISMGGATLNPQMLVSFLGEQNTSPKIHFLNNTDPFFFADLLTNINIKESAFIAISNSGETLETNSLVGCILAEYKKNNITDIEDRAFFITNLKRGMLKNIAEKIGGILIAHQEGISGRYSGLSVVSLLIGLIAGIEVHEYIAGANSVIEDFYTNLDESKPALSACSIYDSSNTNILVNIGYLQKFAPFLEWYCQIIAESLGKDGGGYTPIRGLGPNDQHSMLQLYLDGPKDKLFSLFYVEEISAKLFQYQTTNLNELEFITNKKLAHINKVNFNATLYALQARGLPVRSVILKDMSAGSFGAIVCHLMFEIVLISNLIKLNPFDQPGVELIKAYSKKLMN